MGWDEIGEYQVSTVFLGMDMRSGAFETGDLPILFETMMFDQSGEVVGMGRSCTYDEAAIRHAQVVEKVRIIVDEYIPKIEGQGDE